MLTHTELRNILHYDTTTGWFTWLVKTGRARIGARAGFKHGPHRGIRIHGKLYLEHVLAWYYVTGSYPTHRIDHEDTCGSNNAWENLRKATQSENMCNTRGWAKRKSAHKGVYANHKRFMARIKFNGVSKYLGTFDTEIEAKNAYDKAAVSIHGEFARLD